MRGMRRTINLGRGESAGSNFVCLYLVSPKVRLEFNGLTKRISSSPYVRPSAVSDLQRERRKRTDLGLWQAEETVGDGNEISP